MNIDFSQVITFDMQLELMKSVKLREINLAAEKFLNTSIGMEEVPDFEVQTWGIQAAEARAYMSDSSSPTPVLDKIAEARQVDRIVLIQKAYKKALQYEQMVYLVTGLRQKYEDALKKASTKEEIQMIQPVFECI